MGVVFRDELAAKHHVDGELRSGQELFAKHADLRRGGAFSRARRGRTPAGSHQRKRGGLGVGYKAVAVHRDPVGAAQKAQIARFFSAGSHFGHGDGLEGGLERAEQVEVFATRGAFAGTNQHFFGAAAAGDQADAGLHQTDIRLRRGVDLRAVQDDFAAAAQRHALRRNDDGARRILQRQVDVLELPHGHVDLVPLLLLRRHEQQHQVGADGKIRRLVGHHHCFKVRPQALDAGVQHGHQVAADGVHLGVKLAAQHAVAQVDEAGAGVALDFLRAIFQRLQIDDARRVGKRLFAARGQIKKRTLAALLLIERFLARREQPGHEQRQRIPFLFEPLGKGFDADGVPQLERAQLPGKAPAHGAVHVHNRVRNLRDAPRGVEAHAGDRGRKELGGLVAGGEQGAESLARVVNRLAHFD